MVCIVSFNVSLVHHYWALFVYVHFMTHGCWLILSVYIIMSFDLWIMRLCGNFVITLIHHYWEWFAFFQPHSLLI
jgi:hypothetical protein